MTRRPTTTEAELRKLAAAGLNARQIAERLGIGYSMVKAACAVLGLGLPQGRPWPKKPGSAGKRSDK